MEPDKYFKDYHRKSYIEIEDDSDGTCIGKMFQIYKKTREDGLGNILEIETIVTQIDEKAKTWITDMHFWEPFDHSLVRMNSDWPDSRKPRYYRPPQQDPRIYKSTTSGRLTHGPKSK